MEFIRVVDALDRGCISHVVVRCEHPITTPGYAGYTEGRNCKNGPQYFDTATKMQVCTQHMEHILKNRGELTHTPKFITMRKNAETPTRNVAYLNTVDGFVKVDISGPTMSGVEVIKTAEGPTVKIIDATAITVRELDKISTAFLQS